MKSRFFTNKRQALYIEWNSANAIDWKIIERNFIAAYLSSYKDSPIDRLNQTHLKRATMEWNDAYADAHMPLGVIYKNIIKPLSYYFSHEPSFKNNGQEIFKKELDILEAHFADASVNISDVRDYLIKLQMTRYFFEEEFEEEKKKIHADESKIDYVIARFHDRPIAFFACEENYKSGRVYLRWVTMQPAFHRNGLGEIMLSEIAKHYPEAIGMELYTRKANQAAQAFYKNRGFKAAINFDFEEPPFDGKKTLHLPTSDAVSSVAEFIAFSKKLEPSCRVI